MEETADTNTSRARNTCEIPHRQKITALLTGVAVFCQYTSLLSPNWLSLQTPNSVGPKAGGLPGLLAAGSSLLGTVNNVLGQGKSYGLQTQEVQATCIHLFGLLLFLFFARF